MPARNGVASKVERMNSAPQVFPASSVDPANTSTMPSAATSPSERRPIPAMRRPAGATGGTSAAEAADGPAGESLDAPPAPSVAATGARSVESSPGSRNR